LRRKRHRRLIIERQRDVGDGGAPARVRHHNRGLAVRPDQQYLHITGVEMLEVVQPHIDIANLALLQSTNRDLGRVEIGCGSREAATNREIDGGGIGEGPGDRSPPQLRRERGGGLRERQRQRHHQADEQDTDGQAAHTLARGAIAQLAVQGSKAVVAHGLSSFIRVFVTMPRS
jgi:hypothetical protein